MSGGGGNKTVHSRGLRIATRCDTVEQFIAKFHRFCEPGLVFVPGAVRIVGVQAAFSFDLNGGTAALCGVGRVIDHYTTDDNRFSRPGIVIRISQLQRTTRQAFDDLLAARGNPAGHGASRSRRDATPPPRRSSAPVITVPQTVAPRAHAAAASDRFTPIPAKPGTRTSVVEIVDSVTFDVELEPATRTTPLAVTAVPSVPPRPHPADRSTATAPQAPAPARVPPPSVPAVGSFESEVQPVVPSLVRVGDAVPLEPPVPVAAAIAAADVALPASEPPRARWSANRRMRWGAGAGVAALLVAIPIAILLVPGSSAPRPEAGPEQPATALPTRAANVEPGPTTSTGPARDGVEPSRDGAEPSRDGVDDKAASAEPSRDGVDDKAASAEPSRDGAEPSRDGVASRDGVDDKPASAEAVAVAPPETTPPAKRPAAKKAKGKRSVRSKRPVAKKPRPVRNKAHKRTKKPCSSLDCL